MRLPKRGEKGFTLIELLIVVAILGVLAAVIIPNVTRFVGAGAEEAAETELHNVQLAVTSMMLENGLTSIPVPIDTAGPGLQQTNNMTAFPDIGSVAASDDKKTDPDGYLYEGLGTDKNGYLLYGHDITGNDATTPNPNQGDVNYVTTNTTTYYYTCQADGTIAQWDINGSVLVWD